MLTAPFNRVEPCCGRHATASPGASAPSLRINPIEVRDSAALIKPFRAPRSAHNPRRVETYSFRLAAMTRCPFTVRAWSGLTR